MRVSKKTIDIIRTLPIPPVILALLTGIARIFLELRAVFENSTIAVRFDIMITNVLSTFVVADLLKGIPEFFKMHRINITCITGCCIGFSVPGEIMSGIYAYNGVGRNTFHFCVAYRRGRHTDDGDCLFTG